MKTRNAILLIALLAFGFTISSVAADQNGTLTLSLSNATTKNLSAQQLSYLQSMQVKIVDVSANKIVWEGVVTSESNISIPLASGNYKVYVQGRKSTWEYKQTYNVTSGSTTFVTLNANTLGIDVWADAPWRVEPSKSEIPIMVVVKDVELLDDEGNPQTYELSKIHVYLDANQDESDWGGETSF